MGPCSQQKLANFVSKDEEVVIKPELFIEAKYFPGKYVVQEVEKNDCHILPQSGSKVECFVLKTFATEKYFKYDFVPNHVQKGQPCALLPPSTIDDERINETFEKSL